MKTLFAFVLASFVVSLLGACGDSKPPMVPDQENTAAPDASAD